MIHGISDLLIPGSISLLMRTLWLMRSDQHCTLVVYGGEGREREKESFLKH